MWHDKMFNCARQTPASKGHLDVLPGEAMCLQCRLPPPAPGLDHQQRFRVSVTGVAVEECLCQKGGGKKPGNVKRGRERDRRCSLKNSCGFMVGFFCRNFASAHHPTCKSSNKTNFPQTSSPCTNIIIIIRAPSLHLGLRPPKTIVIGLISVFPLSQNVNKNFLHYWYSAKTWEH